MSRPLQQTEDSEGRGWDAEELLTSASLDLSPRALVVPTAHPTQE